MTSTPHAFNPGHPLIEDRERLEEITDVMYATIHRTLFPWEPRPRRVGTDGSGGDRELILEGTGVSADDVLSEALVALLAYPPERLQETWGGLGVTMRREGSCTKIRASSPLGLLRGA